MLKCHLPQWTESLLKIFAVLPSPTPLARAIFPEEGLCVCSHIPKSGRVIYFANEIWITVINAIGRRSFMYKLMVLMSLFPSLPPNCPRQRQLCEFGIQRKNGIEQGCM